MADSRTISRLLAASALMLAGCGDASVLEPTVQTTSVSAALSASPVTYLDFTAFGISKNSSIIGSMSSGGKEHASFWTQQYGLIDVGTLPGGTTSRATGVNSKGQVVGRSTVNGASVTHAFVWSAAAGMRDLGTLGGQNSVATAINEAGHVVGYSGRSSGPVRAFIWSERDGMRELGALGPGFSIAWALNDAGEVVGAAADEADDLVVPFVWTAGKGMRALPVLGGGNSYAFAINAAGVIGGSSAPAGGGPDHGTLWKNGELLDIGSLGGETTVRAVGPNGEAFGEAYYADDDLGQRAFGWTRSSGIVDLTPATGMNGIWAVNPQLEAIGGRYVARLRLLHR
jgi:probable HAF family extracellular repeat protein